MYEETSKFDILPNDMSDIWGENNNIMSSRFSVSEFVFHLFTVFFETHHAAFVQWMLVFGKSLIKHSWNKKMKNSAPSWWKNPSWPEVFNTVFYSQMKRGTNMRKILVQGNEVYSLDVFLALSRQFFLNKQMIKALGQHFCLS